MKEPEHSEYVFDDTDIQFGNDKAMPVNLPRHPKTYVVINPVSGMLPHDQKLEKIRAALQAHDLTFELYETDGDEDVSEVVREAVGQGYELFVAVGGDGTASAVANGLVDTQVPLAVVPAGTWNALARNLDIPLQIDQALDLLFQPHRIRAIDVMQVGDDFHLLNISAGIGPGTMHNVKRDEKRRFGIFADLWAGLIQLLGFRSFRFEVTIDGKQMRFRALEVMVANTRNIGLKSIQLDPEIHMDDGKLNVCRLQADGLIDFLGLVMSLLSGRQKRKRNIACFEAREEVTIRARKHLLVQADGEIIGRLPVTIKLRQKAVYILTPVVAEV